MPSGRCRDISVDCFKAIFSEVDIPPFREFDLVGPRTAWVDFYNNASSPRIDTLNDMYAVAHVESEWHIHEIVICTKHTQPSLENDHRPLEMSIILILLCALPHMNVSFGSAAANNVLTLLC
jgi:hypothetical protein